MRDAGPPRRARGLQELRDAAVGQHTCRARTTCMRTTCTGAWTVRASLRYSACCHGCVGRVESGSCTVGSFRRVQSDQQLDEVGGNCRGKETRETQKTASARLKCRQATFKRMDRLDADHSEWELYHGPAGLYARLEVIPSLSVLWHTRKVSDNFQSEGSLEGKVGLEHKQEPLERK